MEKSVFEIPKMDCHSEEQLIRLKLGYISSVKNLAFDIPNRKLTIYHAGSIELIEKSISELNLGGRKLKTEPAEKTEFTNNASQKRTLWIVLAINFSFFILEMSTGLISKSMGLVADSLDMLADSFVYGISLFAVGGSLIVKKRVARIAGYFQLLLALIGFFEVMRRFINATNIPDFKTMIIISTLALIANAICLFILQQSRGKTDAHMKASLIFTSNDIIINLGVIVAGVLVSWLNSNKPDLIVGSIVFILVAQGAFRILKLGK